MTTSIIYSNLGEYSICASESSFSSTSNLLNYFSNLYWQSSNSNNNQFLTIFFDENKTFNSLILDNHNFDSIFAIGKLEAANNINFTGSVTAISSLSASDSGPTLYEFNDTTAQYWRIIWTATLASSPRIGNIFLSKKLNFKYNYDFGYKKEDQQFITNEFLNIKGIDKASQNYVGRLIYNLNFKMLNNTFRNSFIDFLNVIKGKLKPFYFVDFNDNIRYMKLNNDYSPIDVQHYGLNDLLNLQMKSLYVDEWIEEPEGAIVQLEDLLETEEFIDTVI